jgi:hypothetical protein
MAQPFDGPGCLTTLNHMCIADRSKTANINNYPNAEYLMEKPTAADGINGRKNINPQKKGNL